MEIKSTAEMSQWQSKLEGFEAELLKFKGTLITQKNDLSKRKLVIDQNIEDRVTQLDEQAEHLREYEVSLAKYREEVVSHYDDAIKYNKSIFALIYAAIFSLWLVLKDRLTDADVSNIGFFLTISVSVFALYIVLDAFLVGLGAHNVKVALWLRDNNYFMTSLWLLGWVGSVVTGLIAAVMLINAFSSVESASNKTNSSDVQAKVVSEDTESKDK